MIYTIEKDGFEISATTAGGGLTSLKFKGREMLAPAEKCGYGHMAIGRYANRIGNAAFTLDGKEYNLTANEGKNMLHAGDSADNPPEWEGSCDGEKIVMKRVSPDGENGFPGNIEMVFTYSVQHSALHVDVEGVSDADTVYAPTLHPYFAFSRDASFSLNSDYRLEVDEGLIPSGKLLPAAPYSLHEPLDTCFMLHDDFALSIEENGITAEVWTDFPAIQVFSGNPAGIALEPEFCPDSPNRPEFPSTVLKAGEKFRKYMEYKFFEG